MNGSLHSAGLSVDTSLLLIGKRKQCCVLPGAGLREKQGRVGSIFISLLNFYTSNNHETAFRSELRDIPITSFYGTFLSRFIRETNWETF